MTLNPSYMEIFGREIQSDRMREAEKERLIKQVRMGNKDSHTSIWSAIHSQWRSFWNRVFRKRDYISVAGIPEKSPSV